MCVCISWCVYFHTPHTNWHVEPFLAVWHKLIIISNELYIAGGFVYNIYRSGHKTSAKADVQRHKDSCVVFVRRKKCANKIGPYPVHLNNICPLPANFTKTTWRSIIANPRTKSEALRLDVCVFFPWNKSRISCLVSTHFGSKSGAKVLKTHRFVTY